MVKKYYMQKFGKIYWLMYDDKSKPYGNPNKFVKFRAVATSMKNAQKSVDAWNKR